MTKVPTPATMHPTLLRLLSHRLTLARPVIEATEAMPGLAGVAIAVTEAPEAAGATKEVVEAIPTSKTRIQVMKTLIAHTATNQIIQTTSVSFYTLNFEITTTNAPEHCLHRRHMMHTPSLHQTPQI